MLGLQFVHRYVVIRVFFIDMLGLELFIDILGLEFVDRYTKCIGNRVCFKQVEIMTWYKYVGIRVVYRYVGIRVSS
jgi:hypothetical protein